MKCQPFYLPRSGKLVTQLPEGITFAYDPYLGCLRDRWKGLTEEYNVEQKMPKKCRLGPQNDPGSLGPEQTAKKF